jgi:hypothetical protein
MADGDKAGRLLDSNSTRYQSGIGASVFNEQRRDWHCEPCGPGLTIESAASTQGIELATDTVLQPDLLFVDITERKLLSNLE